jgi:hypothetical protein
MVPAKPVEVVDLVRNEPVLLAGLVAVMVLGTIYRRY